MQLMFKVTKTIFHIIWIHLYVRRVTNHEVFLFAATSHVAYNLCIVQLQNLPFHNTDVAIASMYVTYLYKIGPNAPLNDQH
jgi:hypothetical protein